MLKCEITLKAGETMAGEIKQLLEKMRDSHSDKYDYPEAYSMPNYRLEMFCKIHNKHFTTNLRSHARNASGCEFCTKEKLSTANAMSQEEFIKRSIEMHGNKYDYSLVKYVNNRTDVELVCQTHGIFTANPNNHLKRKSNCPKCAAIDRGRLDASKAAAKFEQRARDFHGLKYDYSKVDYYLSTSKVVIGCPVHGDFLMAPNNHIQGQGCPLCGESGFKHDRDAILYILKFENLTKVGISNLNYKVRLSQVRRSSGMKFECVEVVKNSGKFVLELERYLLDKLRQTYKNPATWFVGYTETFEDVDYSQLELWINEFIINK